MQLNACIKSTGYGKCVNLLLYAGTEGRKKEKKIGEIMEQCYDKYFVKTGDWTLADFYHAVCETVEYFSRHFLFCFNFVLIYNLRKKKKKKKQLYFPSNKFID